MRTVRGLLGTTLAIVLASLIVLAIFWGTSAQWEQGQSNLAACNDYIPCTSNRLLPDGSCITPARTMRNGTDCSIEDQCYETYKRDAPTTRVRKYCTSDAQCLGPQQYCRGYCDNDTYCLTHLLPLRYDALQSANLTVYCFMHSCVTLLADGFTNDCLSWLSDSETARYTAHCLTTDYQDDVCSYHYRCAPYVLPTTEAPTTEPTPLPTIAPTKIPTVAPTRAPTQVPTLAPTVTPTNVPTQAPTVAPTKVPTVAPTKAPTAPTPVPTTQPTEEPTPEPTAEPP